MCMRSGRKSFDFLLEVERRQKTLSFRIRENSAFRAHNLLNQKRVNCVVVSSKLHISERSTAPYIASTSQPLADRTTLVTRSQYIEPILGLSFLAHSFVIPNYLSYCTNGTVSICTREIFPV
jgi:hypothetical protein